MLLFGKVIMNIVNFTLDDKSPSPLLTESSRGLMVLLEVWNLLSQSLFVSFCQQTPLHIAASKNYERTVECLVDKGADINIKDNTGVSIILYTTVGILCHTCTYRNCPGQTPMGARSSSIKN